MRHQSSSIISLPLPQPGSSAVAYGYEIEYTKLFEDSLSMNFGVPIVGLLGLQPLPPLLFASLCLVCADLPVIGG